MMYRFDLIAEQAVFLIIVAVLIWGGIFLVWWWRSRSQMFTADTSQSNLRPPAMDVFPLQFETEPYIKQGWEQHRAGFFPKAMRHYTDSFEVEPANLPALMQLAILHFDKGDLKTGKQYLQDMMDNPRHYTEEKLLWSIVRVLSQHKHETLAMPYIQRLLEIDPSNAEYKAQLNTMRQVV